MSDIVWIDESEVETEWRPFSDADGEFLCIIDYTFLCEEVNRLLSYGATDLDSLPGFWDEDTVFDHLFCDIWRSHGARPDEELLWSAMERYQNTFCGGYDR